MGVAFLGHVVSPEGVSTVQAVQDADTLPMQITSQGQMALPE